MCVWVASSWVHIAVVVAFLSRAISLRGCSFCMLLCSLSLPFAAIFFFLFFISRVQFDTLHGKKNSIASRKENKIESFTLAISTIDAAILMLLKPFLCCACQFSHVTTEPTIKRRVNDSHACLSAKIRNANCGESQSIGRERRARFQFLENKKKNWSWKNRRNLVLPRPGSY